VFIDTIVILRGVAHGSQFVLLKSRTKSFTL
jgi:hypothetical protein